MVVRALGFCGGCRLGYGLRYGALLKLRLEEGKGHSARDQVAIHLAGNRCSTHHALSDLKI